jgi:hypothetical protein
MNKFCITLLAALLVTSLFAGCHQKSGYSTKAILANPSPEMKGIAETPSEDKAGIAVVNNVNDRLYVDDWRKVLLLDKPSSLTVVPVVQN